MHACGTDTLYKLYYLYDPGINFLLHITFIKTQGIPICG